MQLTHSSLKDYLLEHDTSSIPSYFKLTEENAHTQLASVLVSYLSFKCFEVGEVENVKPTQYLLEYATKWLVYHSVRTGASEQTAEKLATFFQSTPGCKWLHRLCDVYKTSFGHLQIMQSKTKAWAEHIRLSEETTNILCGFLLMLMQDRYEQSRPSNDSY